jgi:Cytochrome c7 and related cytochrome c
LITKRRAVTGVGLASAVVIALPLAAQTAPSAPARAPVISDTARLAGPRQPIFFRHDVHAGQDQIPCLYCHSTATISSEPGIPSLETCFGCHQMIGGSTPSHQAEIKKVRDAWANRTPPVWVRVHALPGFVHFPHMRHIKALGTESCSTCHGDVREMPQIHQVATLTMGWCVDCHVQHNVSRDCTVCHY